jgi:hypothetical protein
VRKKSTRLKIVFFGLLLTGFIGIQYSWVSELQKDKLNQFRSKMTLGLENVAGKKPFTSQVHELPDTSIARMLNQSFLSKGLGHVRFEYGVALCNKHLSSPGFYKKQSDSSHCLVLQYELRHTGNQHASQEILTVLVPSWKKIALRKMGWIIFASVLLTAMLVSVFSIASLLAWRRQQLMEEDRAIQNIMQQLEAPLSTVSVAADALRNARVMHDPGKVDYYQQIITQESKRMNEQVEKFLREIKK